MISVETSVEDWPVFEWDALAERAVSEALDASPRGAIKDSSATIELAVRLTSDAEVQALNRRYRDQDKPTNVLSFPMVQPDLIEALANTDDGEVLLGDIVLAHDICVAEAAERHVSLADHAAHLIVHGTLHLLGYDHMSEADAEAMEAIERAAMASLGLHDPYRDDETPE